MKDASNKAISIHLVAGLVMLQALFIMPSLSSDEASATPPSPTSWTRYAGNPLVTPNPSGWDYNLIYGASLVDTGDEFFFYYTSGDSPNVGLAISSDCKSWTKYAGNPIWTSNCLPCVMKDGSTWKMWYTDASGVCYATSGDGKSWTTVATAVMKFGGTGTIDNTIWSVFVIKDTDGYKMYYTGCDNIATTLVCYATSPDETSWTKYASNPIIGLGPGGSWDDDDTQFPCVLKMSDEYRMWFSAHDGSRVAIGYANSTDGATWKKYASNPVLGYNTGWDASCTMPRVVMRNNTLEMMYTGITTSWTYSVGLAESFGSTPASPTLLSPQNDQWTNDSTPQFSWRFGTPNEQTSFQLQLDDDPAFSPAVYDSGKLATNVTSLAFPSPLADGTYYWRVKAWDLTDSVSFWSPAWKAKVDSTPPQNPTGVASVSHAMGVWSSDNTVEAGWSLPPGGGDISLYAGFGVVWDTGPATVPEMLNIADFSATSSTSDPAAETDSLYFHIRAKDRAGNWADGAVHLGPFAVDATPPQNPTNVSSPSHIPQQWSAGSTMDMTWSEPVAGLSGAEGYAYLWDHQSYTLPQTVLNVSADVRNVSSVALTDGNDWFFHLRTKDRAGNWALNAAHSGPYWIDSTAPSVLNLSVHGGAEFASCQTVRAIMRAEDAPGGSGLSGIRWKLNAGDWSAWENYADSSYIDLDQGDGIYVVQVQVRDLANNTSPVANATIQLDRAHPPEAGVKLNGGAVYTTCATVQVGIVAQDPPPGSGLWNMSFSDDGKNWDPWAPFDETSLRKLVAGDGNKTVHVRLRDRAGNVGPASSASIILDTAPPVTFIPMLPDVVNDLVFDVCWTAADATSGVASFDVQFQDNGGTWLDWLAGTCQTGARFTGLDNHTYRFRALSLDNAGNREAAFKAISDTVRIELPPPILSIAKPAANSTLRGKFTVSGSAGHPRKDMGVVLVEVRIDDGPWRTARGTLSWSYAYDSAKLENGRHTIAVRAFDGTRYSAEEAREFEVNNEKGLSLEGMPLLVLALVLIVVIVAVAAFVMSRSQKKSLEYPPPPVHTPPARPLPPPVAGQYSYGPAPAAPPPPAVRPAGSMVVEGTISVKDLEREPGEPGGAMAPEQAVAPVPPPEAPRKPRTADDEQAMREARVLQSLSSLPRGLPASLWGIDMEELASKVVSGERKDSPDGDMLVRIGNRWYYGDEANLGLFMQEYRK